MEFLFFDAADTRLFARSDAERATWTVEEMSLNALFPYDAEKPIRRGQRIGFVDDTGSFQPFEIRRVKTYEPDHYQEITAEHIVISELSDEHQKKYQLDELDPQTAWSALYDILLNTLWMRGTNGASNLANIIFDMGSVWQAVRAIEQTWNVYITPRVLFNGTSITGRYLDVAPAEPVWRGMRLSLDKNADEVGVTWDDTSLITAIYGYGGMIDPDDDGESEILTFKDVAWAETPDHPAKALGSTVLIDPVATDLYGRAGRPRYGYYQNSEIKDANVLLEKSWEALKNSNKPNVSIECQVRDLYRLGYDDKPLRLHDAVIIEVRPTGEMLQREIIRLTVDLLDPTATRVTIGQYIPNIVYMQRQTQKAAAGSGGGGRHGDHGTSDADGQDNRTYEFQTSMQANQYQIVLVAKHTDTNSSILQQAGLSLNAQGVLVYATDNANMWQSKLNVQADRIGLVVSGSGANASIKAAEIVASINNTGSSVTISADKIYLSGETTIDRLLTGHAKATAFWATQIQADETFNFKHHNAKWQPFTFLDNLGNPVTATFLIQDNAARNSAEEREEK